MIVLDASAVVEVLQPGEARQRLTLSLRASGRPWCAPHLVDVECLSAVRRLVRTGKLSRDRGREALGDLLALPLTRYPHQLLLPRAFELRDELSPYDAMYVALAEVLEATLVTCDAKLASGAASYVEVDLRAASPLPEGA